MNVSLKYYHLFNTFYHSKFIHSSLRHFSKPTAPFTHLVTESHNGRKRVFYLYPKSTRQKKHWTFKEKNVHQKNSFIFGFMRDMFLPIGFPHTVHKVYLKSHIWQFFETLVGSTMFVLCSQSMLSSVGVNDPTPLETGASAVAINWVLKDTIGEIVKLGFIQKYAKSFDSHPKSWKLIGEMCSLTGSFLQLSTILVPNSYFLLFAGIGFGLRSIHFSIWGATHMTFTRNYALQGNVGDVVAKDDSQMSLAHLIGTLLGVGLLSFSHETWMLFVCFSVLGPIHLYTTVALLHSTRFAILNQTSLCILSQEFVEKESILSLDQVETKTKWFNEWMNQTQSFHVVIASSFSEAFMENEHSLSLEQSLKVFKNESFLLGYNQKKKTYYLCLDQSATHVDVIRALLLIQFYEKQTEKNIQTLIESNDYSKKNISIFIDALEDAGWDTTAVFWSDQGIRVDWSAIRHFIK